jgi:type II secretory pathway component GspD/PulD (secretin)
MFARALTLALTAALLGGSFRPALAGCGPNQACPCSQSQAKLITKTYAVADLVIPIAKKAEVTLPPGSSAEPAKKSKQPHSKASPTLEVKLMKLITTTIAPQSWGEKGGLGQMEYFPLTMSLVIQQSPDVHEQINDMLAALRRLQDVEVAVEVRFITTSDECMERLGLGCAPQIQRTVDDNGMERIGIDFNVDTMKSPGVHFLSDVQMRQLMEAVQGDTRTNVMQAPKMTVFNGQKSILKTLDTQNYVTGIETVRQGDQVVFAPKVEAISTGIQMSLQPVVSADHRFVQVSLNAKLSDLDPPTVPLFPIVQMITPKMEDGSPGQPVAFTQYIQQPKVRTLCLDRKVMIPDGGTVLLGGLKRTREVRQEYGPPVLSKVPYVNRLFKNVGYARENETVLVLVTPRIIINEEQEEAKPKAAACPQPVAPAKERMTDLMQKFQMLFKEGKYEEAERCARDAHVLDPDNPTACAAVVLAERVAKCHACPSASPVPVLTKPSCCPAEVASRPKGGVEEQEMPPSEKKAPTLDRRVAKLIAKYRQACAAGHIEEAHWLAREALALDPTCFSK